MTLFTSGRLQVYERMMKDTGDRNRSRAEKKTAKQTEKKKKSGKKAGDRHAGVPS